MTMPVLPMTGGCRCGAVRFRVTAPPIITSACHCAGCQRMTASAFSLSAAFREGAFVITEGEPVIGGLHGPEARHHHCDHCKSWLFTRWGDMVNLRATMLDDPGWFEPFLETWTRERLPWATTPAQHSFEEFPPMEAFGDLIAEYARHISRT